MKPSSDYELLSACNYTELFQVCQRLGLPVSPDLPKDTIIKIILGEEPPPESWSSVMDSWRDAIMAFLLDHWDVVRSQLECPAKSGNPKSCYECIDTRVISCLVDNAPNETLIQLKRKKTT